MQSEATGPQKKLLTPASRQAGTRLMARSKKGVMRSQSAGISPDT